MLHSEFKLSYQIIYRPLNKKEEASMQLSSCDTFHSYACVCIHTIIDTHISSIFFEAVGPCMLRQSLPIILLMYSAGSISSSSRFVCVFMCITLSLTFNRNGVLKHQHWFVGKYSQRSCRCRWCRTTHAGNTPPAFGEVGWGSGGSE